MNKSLHFRVVRWNYIAIILLLSALDPISGGESTSGRELRESENKAQNGWRPWLNSTFEDEPKEKSTNNTISIEKSQDPDNYNPAQFTDGKKYFIREVEFQGEISILSSHKSLKTKLFGNDPKPPLQSLQDEVFKLFDKKKMSKSDIRKICSNFTKKLIGRGYLLAYISPETQELSDGILFLNIQLGQFGGFRSLRFREDSEFHKNSHDIMQPEKDEEKLLRYDGKYFGESQIRRKLSFRKGDIFNYKQLYQDVFSLNQHPKLNINSLLRLRSKKIEGSDGLNDDKFQKNIVDIDFLISEKLPLNSALQVDNTGTVETGDWRARATIQYSNLTKFTKQFDILTLDLSLALDGSLYGATGSYTYPDPLSFIPRIPTHSFNVIAGVSQLEVDDIVTSVDDEGDGWFVGGQFQLDLLSKSAYTLALTLGVIHRSSENQQLVQGTVANDREITMTPLSIGLRFANHGKDPLNGLNLVTLAYHINSGGFLGGDNDEEFEDFRVGADSDFQLSRFQFTRIQRLFDYHGEWRLYLKADAQYTYDQLVSLEQKALGGMNTVRGYPEREIIGDKGISTTIELRTPRFDLPRFPIENHNNRIKRIASILDTTQLSFLTFYDYGNSRINDPLPGEEERVELSSVGVGLRMNIAEHFKVSFDYGFTLKDLPNDENDDGRGHLVVRYQF